MCLKSCPEGIVEEKKCVCCNFEGFKEYSALVEQYNNLTNTITTAGESNRNISLAIADLKTQITQFKDFVLQNCNSKTVDVTTVSEKLSYMRTKLIPFKMNVEKFVSNIKPRPHCAGSKPCPDGYVKGESCWCMCYKSCAKSKGLITNYDYCECESLPKVSVLDGIRNKITDYILTLTMAPDEASSELIQECKSLFSTINSFFDLTMKRWSSTTLEQKTKTMDIIEENARTLFAKIDPHLVTGSCATGCDLTQIQMKNCSCYYSKQFNGKLNELMVLETKIAESINSGKGNLTKLEEVKKLSTQLRLDAVKFVELVKDGNENIVIDGSLAEFTANLTTLDTEYKAYSASPTPPKCTIDCQGDKVRNTQKCACFDVDSWVKLNTEVKNGLTKLRQDAESLSNDLDAKANLLSNVKELETGIPELVAHTNLIFGLDEDYVKKRCLQLVELYLRTSSAIKSASGGIAMEVCDVNCPRTGGWTIPKYPACTCECPSTTCKEPSKFDPFKCDCVPTNPNCSLTKSSCDSSQLFDYTNCMCKSKP